MCCALRARAPCALRVCFVAPPVCALRARAPHCALFVCVCATISVCMCFCLHLYAFACARAPLCSLRVCVCVHTRKNCMCFVAPPPCVACCVRNPLCSSSFVCALHVFVLCLLSNLTRPLTVNVAKQTQGTDSDTDLEPLVIIVKGHPPGAGNGQSTRRRPIVSRLVPSIAVPSRGV